jgi:enoyl-CoA hydratase/carnithine racemase
MASWHFLTLTTGDRADGTDGRVTRITLDRPEKRNALGLRVMQELVAALQAVPDDSAVVVLGANGPAFSSGHDLSEMLEREAEFYDELFAVCTELMLALHELPQPVVARVQGVATAAGCQLVAASDLAIAADTAWFATPGVRIGLFCSTPMVPLSRAIGRKRALEMLLTGDPVPATTAAEWGLVNRVVPPDELDHAVDALLAPMLRASPAVLALGKRAFYAQIDRSEADAYGMAAPVMADNAIDPVAQEGIDAFLTKRDPDWPR